MFDHNYDYDNDSNIYFHSHLNPLLRDILVQNMCELVKKLLK